MADPVNPKKRRREPVNVDVKLVEIYEDLASEKNEIRLKAAQELLSRFTPDQNTPEDQIEKALKRLFRGLCSNRNAARIGFSIALTELLSQVFPGPDPRNSELLNIPKAIEILESQTNPVNCSSGQEERDHYFGRLFGAEAILKSAILYQPNVQLKSWTKVLSLVFDLAKKKPWLKEECGYVIYSAVRDINSRKADVQYVNTIIKALADNGLAKTPEGVAIWLAAMECPLSVNFVSGLWHSNNPLHSKERTALAKILRESSDPQSESGGENGNTAKSGVWNPKLHFAWDPILAKFYAVSQVKKGDKASKHLSFIDFWTEVVDNGLFSAASSEERKYWGFLVTMKVVNDGPKEAAGLIFLKNFIRCLVNQLSVEDRYLHRIAQRTAKAIQARGTADPEFIAPALRGLMGPAGAINFDQVTKTKTIEKLIGDGSTDGLEGAVPFMESLIVKPEVEDIKVAGSRRQQLATFLMSIVKSLATNQTSPDGPNQVIRRVMLALARFAYFMPSGDSGVSAPDPPISKTTQEFFKNKMSTCLNIIISGQQSGPVIACQVIQDIREMEKKGEYGKFVIEMGDEISESVHTAFKVLKKLEHKEKGGEKAQLSSIQALKLLYVMTIFQIYNGDTDAISMLDELKICYDKFFSRKKVVVEEVSEDTNASDILVEIVLSFASKQSQLFRRASEQVFSAFANQVTASGLDSLISILQANESLTGQQELFEDGGDDSDVEMIDLDEVSDEETDSSADSDEGSEEDDSLSSVEAGEDESEDEDELAEFDAKLAAALGTHRAESDPDASESDTDSDMDDEQMEALDEHLAQVFKTRKQSINKEKEKKDARETMVNFKNRVLDFLEIYVKKSHSNILATNILLPLLQVSRKSRVQQIANKASNVLREYCKLCKGSNLPTVEDEEWVWELLRSIHEEATHSGPTFHATACSQASLLVVKILAAHSKENMEDIVDVYAKSRKNQLLSKKCHIQPSFFSDWNNWCVSASKQMKE